MKKQKEKYFVALKWFKASLKENGEINSADKVSCFPFLNYYDEAIEFSSFCESIREKQIANLVVEVWTEYNKNKSK